MAAAGEYSSSPPTGARGEADLGTGAEQHAIIIVY